MSGIPRNFKLLDEIDNDSKYTGISYGLKEADDIKLEYFTGMVIDSRGIISNFEIYCSQKYPKEAPTVELIDTDSDTIDNMFRDCKLKTSCEVIKGWKESSCIADILLHIQKVGSR